MSGKPYIRYQFSFKFINSCILFNIGPIDTNDLNVLF